jgi:hypothetical protein
MLRSRLLKLKQAYVARLKIVVRVFGISLYTMAGGVPELQLAPKGVYSPVLSLFEHLQVIIGESSLFPGVRARRILARLALSLRLTHSPFPRTLCQHATRIESECTSPALAAAPRLQTG